MYLENEEPYIFFSIRSQTFKQPEGLNHHPQSLPNGFQCQLLQQSSMAFSISDHDSLQT